ncbi:hypothetical protein A2393_00250 [Candidatus Woesebacteria bacterium RIFOXYB1_FULL_41_13]|uniref:Peptidase C39 domain-containing protein n=1 Tax=Candidatus Woesebacteria bacterium RIFOXYB1_FULL_41_13 TaxID=1802540 RepID=A0A1F8CYM5_9BACT|nr:MAG: hypothetical protein A2393_00250 [Candidatus Woesebacteria bacterium RIFOXYB1_FULL_41_13]
MELEKNKKTRKLLRALLSLEDRVVGKPFPGMKRVRQISSYHCGPAVIVELLSFLGKSVSQIAVVRSIKAKDKIKRLGLNIHDLAKATASVGKKEVVFWRKRQSTINDLSNIVNKYHYPVAVEWQGVFYEDEDEDNGHYAVITKVDKKSNYLRICDSYADFAGVDRRFRIKVFEKRWWDVNKINGKNIVDKKMMFVVTTKGETWPRKLGMVKI